jgi:hypothetical protein
VKTCKVNVISAHNEWRCHRYLDDMIQAVNQITDAQDIS